MTFKVKDYFYRKAKSEDFLARSIYKLEEIDKKFGILKRSDRVLDLGCHPGSWTQYASEIVGKKGRVVGVDQRYVSEKIIQLSNVKFCQGDVFKIDSLDNLGEADKFSVVLSDMAPQTTGMKEVDQARSLELVMRVMDFLPVSLRQGGRAVVKVFESQEAHGFLKGVSSCFDSVHFFKPHSTRSVSKEFFAIAKGFRYQSVKD